MTDDTGKYPPADIAERLLRLAQNCDFLGPRTTLTLAADEILRLRAELDQWRTLKAHPADAGSVPPGFRAQDRRWVVSVQVAPPRYRVIGQSTTCPDGYDRMLFYVWDSHDESILAADHERVVCEGYAAKLNRGRAASE